MSTPILGKSDLVVMLASNFFFSTDEDDLFDVIKDLTPVAARWKAIGIALRLKPGELNSINSGRPDECLGEVILNWLMRNYNVDRFGLPTWRKLVEVVEDPAAGNNKALADEIARKHLTSKEDRKTCLGNLALYLAYSSSLLWGRNSFSLVPRSFSSSHMAWLRC